MERIRSRIPHSNSEVENNWAISYGDMITLLLGFFVIFFNIRTETMNLKLIKKDLDKYFETGQKSEKGRSIAEAAEDSEQKTAPVLTSDISNIIQLKSNIEGERILVEFPGVSFFNSASDQLTKNGKTALSNFSKAIQGHLGAFRLVVRGYTDGKALKQNARYKDNLELSAFRSISAIRFLAKEGMNLENMRIAGYGESSLSRAEQSQDSSINQRKIVIVIEPLDHTERMSQKKKSDFQDGTIPIESVKEVQIKKRMPTSIEREKMNALDFGKISLRQGKQYLENYALWIDGKLESSPAYHKLIDWVVEAELRFKGYSRAEIEKMKNDKETKDTEGKVQ